MYSFVRALGDSQVSARRLQTESKSSADGTVRRWAREGKGQSECPARRGGVGGSAGTGPSLSTRGGRGSGQTPGSQRGQPCPNEGRARDGTGSLTRCHPGTILQVSLGLLVPWGKLSHCRSYKGAVKQGGLCTPADPESLSFVSKELHPSYSLAGVGAGRGGAGSSSVHSDKRKADLPRGLRPGPSAGQRREQGGRERRRESRGWGGVPGTAGQEDTGFPVSANQKRLCCVMRERESFPVVPDHTHTHTHSLAHTHMRTYMGLICARKRVHKGTLVDTQVRTHGWTHTQDTYMRACTCSYTHSHTRGHVHRHRYTHITRLFFMSLSPQPCGASTPSPHLCSDAVLCSLPEPSASAPHPWTQAPPPVPAHGPS